MFCLFLFLIYYNTLSCYALSSFLTNCNFELCCFNLYTQHDNTQTKKTHKQFKKKQTNQEENKGGETKTTQQIFKKNKPEKQNNENKTKNNNK